MQSDRRESSQSLYKEFEQRMQREAYEHAGVEAYARGVPRTANPYARPPGVYSAPADQERLQCLAQHWWRGWDNGAVRLEGRRHRQPAG